MGSAEPEIPRHLLPAVARTFAITIRLLPAPIRPPIELAYLLARLSDTKADGASKPEEEELLSCEASLLLALERSPDRDLIAGVWATIREGQTFDSRRFASDKSPLSAEELDRYTYLVAGCVGEFWTDLCARHLPGFARLPAAELRGLGVHFGKALQLVNILRDRRKDAALGRIYLPEETFSRGLASARCHMGEAERYVRALRRGRLRAACALPYLLARETLDLVESDPSAPDAKVSRSRVRTLLFRALLF